MSAYAPTPRTRLHRRPARGTYDQSVVHAILDEALFCHLAFAVEGQPIGLPTTFVREDETLFVHGSAASRMMRALAGELPVCLTVTLLDGLVLARSAFHHSMNYRSVVVLGIARDVVDPNEKRRALMKLIDKVSPGRSAFVRAPSDKELGATSVLALPIEEVSAKVRTGPPIDDEVDMAVRVWAGVVPVSLRASSACPDGPDLAVEQPPLPDGVRGRRQ
jgi:nitroimidazol reductase NimA-like FMN-containing flavoprotein (pyridoxamine 5'-phosphate oxidase superfamily)